MVHSPISEDDEIPLLRKIYRRLIDTGFPAEAGVSREAFECYFKKIADLLRGRAPEKTDEEKRTRTIVLRTDGAARGNPGKAGIGFVLCDAKGETLEMSGAFIGEATNNVAEYKALLAGLQAAVRYGADAIRMETDSSLLVNQTKGEWKIKNRGLLPLARQVHEFLAAYRTWEIVHIPREENELADRLANEGIDSGG
jgi:ribonuclease HI